MMTLSRLKTLAFSFSSAAGMLLLPPAAQAADALYQCPYLDSEKHQLLYDMSQGKDGWFFRENTDFKEDFFLSDETAHYLTRMKDALAVRGTSLVFVPLPVRAMVADTYLLDSEDVQKNFDTKRAHRAYTQYIADLRQKTGLTVVDVLDSDTKLNSDYFFKRDIHWTTEGARFTAEKIGEAIKALPAYKNITPSTYETTAQGAKDMKGKIFLELLRLCTSQIPAEKVPVFETRLKATGADALFGSDQTSSALIGTSFSEMDILNFDGFLSEYTGLPIANYAIGAGELFIAMISYVNSPGFKDNPPPFMFWETPGHYNINLNSASYFRQIIPAIKGECSKENTVAKRKFEIKDGKGGELLSIPADAKVHGSNYYLALSSNNVGLINYTLELEYENGDGEWFTIDHTSRYKTYGRNFVELWDDIDSPLTSVRLQDAGKINATIDITLCKSNAQDIKATP